MYRAPNHQVKGSATSISTLPMTTSGTPRERFSHRLAAPIAIIAVGIASTAMANSPVFTATVMLIHTLRYHAALSKAQNSSPMELLRPSESSSAQLAAPNVSGAIMHNCTSESRMLSATSYQVTSAPSASHHSI